MANAHVLIASCSKANRSNQVYRLRPPPRSKGAPHFGKRGRGALVDPEALLRWRSTRGEVDLNRIAAGIWRAYAMAPEGYKEPAWAELGIGRFGAAALLAETFAAIAIELTGKPPESVPLEIQRLTAIALRKELRDE